MGKVAGLTGGGRGGAGKGRLSVHVCTGREGVATCGDRSHSCARVRPLLVPTYEHAHAGQGWV